MRIRCLPAALVVMTVGLTACGESSSNDVNTPSISASDGLTLAAADGTWFVTSYRVDGQTENPGANATAVIDLNVSTLTLEGAAGCGTFLGSFTLGTASDSTFAGFTIPGRSESDCAAATREVEDQVIAALEGVTSFRLDGDDLKLVGPTTAATLSPAG